MCTLLSRACDCVAVKSTGTWIYGGMKIWTEDHFHFLVPLHISSLSHEAYYNAAKVMRSTIAVCVEAGGLAVRTTVGTSTTMFLSRRYKKGIPLSLTQSLVCSKRLCSRVVVATCRLSYLLSVWMLYDRVICFYCCTRMKAHVSNGKHLSSNDGICLQHACVRQI